MPLLLRLVVVIALAYLAGSTLTPLLWGPVLARQSRDILSPFALTSAGIFIAALGYALSQLRKK